MQEQRQAQQAAIAQQQQMQQDLAAASQDISRIPALMVSTRNWPTSSGHANDAANTQQAKANFDMGSQVLSAPQIGRADGCTSPARPGHCVAQLWRRACRGPARGHGSGGRDIAGHVAPSDGAAHCSHAGR